MSTVVGNNVIDYAVLVVQSACLLISDRFDQPYDEAIMIRSYDKLVRIWEFAIGNIKDETSNVDERRKQAVEFWAQVADLQLGGFKFEAKCDDTTNVDGGCDRCTVTVVPLNRAAEITYFLGNGVPWRVSYVGHGVNWKQ